MKLCRFAHSDRDVHVGAIGVDGSLRDLTPAGVTRLDAILEQADPIGTLSALLHQNLPRLDPASVRYCAPVEQQEVWAAGVTYLRSKAARMEESDFSATAYDRVYSAPRPEIFFKSVASKVVTTGDAVGIRRDARWSVPEPELALVLNSSGRLVGCTAANDMSSRDIEGENLLYLPQAKIYERSCALGPWITLGISEETVRQWRIRVRIQRGHETVFSGDTAVSQIKRTFAELAGYLFRSQKFPHGAVLLTGTGVVPPDDFTLLEGDVVEIEIDGIGILRNPVVVV
ncbi:MAG TPA: fumarylacetoacetate hydrolase family protein [Candidatus Didemnitutus sp.]|jgi:2-dehydro-3-deoxy-D-arabinonate dehydratase